MVDKSKMVDSLGRPITQSLFLECSYSESSIYTLKDNDFEYNGKILPSIKRLYLELADPTEYEFANMYFLNWRHWIRITENARLVNHISEWREELEIKIRSQASKQMIEAAKSGNYQAIKWLTDRGWVNKTPGRPSKLQIAHNEAVEKHIKEEYSADVHRLFK